MGVTAIAKPEERSLTRVVMDAWKNAVSGLGTFLKDKRMSSLAEFEPMQPAEAQELYAADDVAAKVVDAVPDDGLRQWGTFTAPGDTQFNAVMQQAFDALRVRAKFRDGWRFGRMVGGAALLMVVDDSEDLSMPLRLDGVRSLKSLVLLMRQELKYGQIDSQLDSPRFGQPTTYFLQPNRGQTDVQLVGQEIHHSRLLIFHGTKLPPDLYVTNGYWHDSVLSRTQNAIRNYSTSHDAAATIMQEFSQPVFKMKGLAALIQAGKGELIAQRLEMVQLARSICRAAIIDQDEDLQSVGAALTGAPDMLKAVGGRLVAASNMPHTKILGESPSGLGATGESEMEDWDDYVANEQELVALDNVLRLAEVMMAAKDGPTRGKIPAKWSFEFKPLRQPDEIQQAELRNKQADTDTKYITAAVLDPDEVRQSRFGSGAYSTETTVQGPAPEPTAADDPNAGGKTA
jgi:phage-related protein (TIGR01555 family)